MTANHKCAEDSLHALGSSRCPFTAEGDVKREFVRSETIVTGWDVTMGGHHTGEVVKVIAPMPYSGQYGFLYRIQTDERYSNGRRIQRVVSA